MPRIRRVKGRVHRGGKRPLFTWKQETGPRFSVESSGAFRIEIDVNPLQEVKQQCTVDGALIELEGSVRSLMEEEEEVFELRLDAVDQDRYAWFWLEIEFTAQ